MNLHMLHLAKHNAWANDRIIQDCSKLDHELLHQTIVSSFPSIILTVRHIWFGQIGWLSRLKGRGWRTDEVDEFTGAETELFTALMHSSNDYIRYIDGADLDQHIDFMHQDRSYSISASDILSTVFYHGSYHRGQIVTMMRQLEISDISQTDYIEWVREQQRKS